MPSSSHAEWNCTLVKKCQKLWKHGTQLSTYGEQESHMNSPPPPPIPWTSNTWPCFANLNKRACKAVDMIHENIFYRKDKENWTYARITEEIKKRRVLKVFFCHNWDEKSKLLRLAHIPFTQVRQSIISWTFLKKVSKLWICP